MAGKSGDSGVDATGIAALLGDLPSTGDRARWCGWTFEVVDLDGRRVDKVLASRLPETHRPARRAAAG